MPVITRLLFGLSIVVPWLKGYAADFNEKISIGIDGYADNGDVQVYSPTFAWMKSLGERWLIGLKLRIDAIAAASIRNGGRPYIADAVAGASSKEGFDDVRYAPTFTFGYDDGVTNVGGGVYYSTENDYTGTSVFGHYTRQFNQNNTAVTIAFSAANDRWSPTYRRNLPVDYRKEYKLDLSVYQLLSPTDSMQLVFSSIRSNGFLSSPYHYVLQENFARFERYPDSRTGYAFAVKGVHAVDVSDAVHYGYRYYSDDWGIRSHTFETEWLHDFSDTFTSGIRLRHYTQTGADFAKPLGSYKPTDTYFAIDYRMTAFRSYDIGIPVRYKPNTSSPYTVTFSIDYYRTDQNEYIQAWYGKPYLQAVYTTLNIAYAYE